MSYILDALRRAQAERGRGSVPDLHTPATPVTGQPVANARAARGLAWLLAGWVVAAGLAGAGWWLWRTPSTPAVPAVPVAVPKAESVAPVTASAAGTTEAAPAPAPQRVEKRAPAPPPAARPERRATTAPEAPAAAPKPAPARPAPQATQAPVFAQADLPPAVREQLPTLQLAGVTYSANPLYRMVIVNGQVLHEGDQAAPGLVLERIEPERTVWAFRGYRYALPAQ